MSDKEDDEGNPVTKKVVGPLLYQGCMVGLMAMAGLTTLGLKLLAKLWGVDKSAEAARRVERRLEPMEPEGMSEEEGPDPWETDPLTD